MHELLPTSAQVCVCMRVCVSHMASVLQGVFSTHKAAQSRCIKEDFLISLTEITCVCLCACASVPLCVPPSVCKGVYVTLYLDEVCQCNEQFACLRLVELPLLNPLATLTTYSGH